MTEPKLAKPRRNYIYAALSAAVGAYFLAVGLGLFPIPGGPSNLHGPLWLLACAGLAFFLAGIAIAFQTLGQANAAGDLPAAAPRWMRALQYLIGLAIFCYFGAIATWIAFGPGERQFSGTFLFFDPATNAAIGGPPSASAQSSSGLCTVAAAAAGFRKFLAK
jgi:hypothetical protein